MVHFTRACKTLLSENNKTRLTFEKQQEKNKNIICRPWSVRIEKNCALGLEHGPRPAASGRTQDLWHSFSQYGPPGRQIIYISLGTTFPPFPTNWIAHNSWRNESLMRGSWREEWGEEKSSFHSSRRHADNTLSEPAPRLETLSKLDESGQDLKRAHAGYMIACEQAPRGGGVYKLCG